MDGNEGKETEAVAGTKHLLFLFFTKFERHCWIICNAFSHSDRYSICPVRNIQVIRTLNAFLIHIFFELFSSKYFNFILEKKLRSNTALDIKFVSRLYIVNF